MVPIADWALEMLSCTGWMLAAASASLWAGVRRRWALDGCIEREEPPWDDVLATGNGRQRLLHLRERTDDLEAVDVALQVTDLPRRDLLGGY